MENDEKKLKMTGIPTEDSSVPKVVSVVDQERDEEDDENQSYDSIEEALNFNDENGK